MAELGCTFRLCCVVCSLALTACNTSLNREQARKAIEQSREFRDATTATFTIGKTVFFNGIGATRALEGSVLEEIGTPCEPPPGGDACWYDGLTSEGEKLVKEYKDKGLLSCAEWLPPNATEQEKQRFKAYETKKLAGLVFGRPPHDRATEIQPDDILCNVKIGDPSVQVTGIRRESPYRETANFDWRFSHLDDFGRRIRQADSPTPFQGHAIFQQYDDGWRLEKVTLDHWFGRD